MERDTLSPSVFRILRPVELHEFDLRMSLTANGPQISNSLHWQAAFLLSDFSDGSKGYVNMRCSDDA
jgi:hypothetical protein